MSSSSGETNLASRMRDMLAPVRGPSRRAEKGDGSSLTSDFAKVNLPSCETLAASCAKNQRLGQIVFSGLLDKMRADLVIRTEHHKGVEVQQYPSV